MPHHIRTTLVVLLALLIASCHSAESYYEKAVKLGEQEKYTEAIALLDKALEKDPEYLDAIINHGFYNMNLSKNKEAITDFEKAVALDPDNTLALYNIGCCKYNLKDYAGSVQYYNKALDTKGGPRVTLDRAPSPLEDSKSRYDVKNVEIIYSRAESYADLDSIRPAYFDFKHCIANNYEVAYAYYNIAYLYFASNMTEDACSALDSAIRHGLTDVSPDYLKRCETKQTTSK